MLDDNPAAPDAETKPQQSPSSDGGLDEIVRGAVMDLYGEDYESANPVAMEADADIIRAACIRARETDPKLAAVRAWRDEFIEWGPGVSRGWLTKMERKLDAILDGKEADHEWR